MQEKETMVDCNTKHRTNLSLCIEGATQHDELLLKSLLNLLNYRTTHHWTFGSDSVDLQIIGEHSSKWKTETMLANVLWLGCTEPRQSPILHLPIHVNEFELLLNSLGSKIIEKQNAAHKIWPSPIHPDENFTLHRWPPSSMLGTSAKIKLATLMTGHPVSINTLIQRSGITAHDCEAFCQTLDRAGLLQRHDVSAEHPKPDQSELPKNTFKVKPDLSFLSQIRRRLGL